MCTSSRTTHFTPEDTFGGVRERKEPIYVANPDCTPAHIPYTREAERRETKACVGTDYLRAVYGRWDEYKKYIYL